MFRKMLICATLALLAALPLMDAFAEGVSAATSRVAIIKELKGSVTVKKAGGTKEFKAFARMSLNQGDVLTTGSEGSAVLQFANGSSEDDRMSVTAGTMLTFSKLSNAKGTSTKVSMWSGSAWVDVKSIANENDEFTLETPTAAMGVRGTHLLVSVDPLSGATSLTVAAGVVAASSPGREGGGEPKRVYPTWSALFADSEAGDSEIAIAPVDLELLMSRSDANIVQAILASAAEIVLENRRYVEQYEQEGIPAELGVSAEDLARFKSNTGNLLGAIASQAVKSGLLDRERLDRIIGEVKSQSGIVIDPAINSLVLSDEEKRQQDEQRKKREAAQERAEQRRQQAEADRKASELLMGKLEEARNAKEEANRKAAEEKRQGALEAYVSQLSATEKERFDADKKKRQDEAAATSPSPTPGSSTPSSGSSSPTNEAPSSNADLSGLVINYDGPQNTEVTAALDPAWDPAITTYSATVPNTADRLTIKPTAADAGKAGVRVNGQPLSGGAAMVQLGAAGRATEIAIAVTAEDASTKTYTLHVSRQPYLLGAGEVAIAGFDSFSFDPAVFEYEVGTVSHDTSALSLILGTTSSGLQIDAIVTTESGSMPGVSVSSGEPIQLLLATGANTIAATLTKQGLPPQTYKFTVVREKSSNAELDGFSLIYFGNQNSQEFVQLDPAFAPETTEYTANVPNEVSELTLWAMADEDGVAEVKVNGTPLIDHEASIPLGEAGSTTTVNIVVTAEDGVATRLYQVDVHRNAYWLGAGEVMIAGAVYTAFDPAVDTYDLGTVPYSQLTLPMVFGESSYNLEIDVHVALKYDGYWVKASGATANVELAAGTNVITAQVRYKDPVTWQKDPDVDYYTFTVFREWGLSDLTMSYAYQQGQSMSVVLDQAFNQEITEYAAEVPPDVSELSVLPSVNADDAVTMTVNGQAASSGTATNIQLGAAGTTTTVEIALTARDSFTKVYHVEVTRQSYSSDASITAFDVNIGQGATAAGVVYEDSKTILLPVPYGTDLTALVPTIGHTGVSLSPESGVAQNFETPVTYTVMAENGTPQVYTVVAAATGDNIALNLYGGQQGQTYPQASASHSVDANNSPWNAVNGTFLYGDSDHDRWANWGQGDNDWLEVEFASVRAWNRIALYLYNDGGGTQAPASYRVEYSNDEEHWSEVSNPVYSPQTPAAARNTDVADAGQPDITKLDTLNTVTFDTVMAKYVRVIFKNGPGAYVGVVELEVYYD